MNFYLSLIFLTWFIQFSAIVSQNPPSQPPTRITIGQGGDYPTIGEGKKYITLSLLLIRVDHLLALSRVNEDATLVLLDPISPLINNFTKGSSITFTSNNLQQLSTIDCEQNNITLSGFTNLTFTDVMVANCYLMVNNVEKLSVLGVTASNSSYTPMKVLSASTVLVQNSTFVNNYIVFWVQFATSGLISDSLFTASTGEGALAIFGSNLNVTGCQFTDNQNPVGFNGGGIALQSSEVLIKDCLISGNGGTGVFLFNNDNSNGTATIENCNITNNFGVAGGGIDAQNYNLVVRNSIISGNQAVVVPGFSFGGVGGGLYLLSQPNATQQIAVIENSIISDNNSPGDGGGILVTGISLSLVNCIVDGNNSTTRGGAIWADGLSYFTMNIENSIISSNQALTTDGGGLFLTNAGLNIKNSSFENNYSSGRGGGLYILASSTLSTIIQESSFSSNTANIGGAIFSQSNDFVILNSSLGHNAADISGSAIYISNTTAIFATTIITPNVGLALGCELSQVELQQAGAPVASGICNAITSACTFNCTDCTLPECQGTQSLTETRSSLVIPVFSTAEVSISRAEANIRENILRGMIASTLLVLVVLHYVFEIE
jgi:hypothetical protein